MNGLLPFEADTYIPAEILQLKAQFGLTHCIETGTQFGATTEWFCQHFDRVISIEADNGYLAIAKERLKSFDNVSLIEAMSEDALASITESNAIYYLDAHGCEIGGCPLKQELQIIARAKVKNILIAIHDFQVPGTDFGFDEYDYPLSIEEIKPYLKKIFKKPTWHYNTKANGAYRGIIYVYEDTQV